MHSISNDIITMKRSCRMEMDDNGGKVVALMKVRGTGSSLEGKNVYPLNGTPVLVHAIRILKRARFIDRVYVWSESGEIKRLALKNGAVAIDRPLSMVHYNSGFHTGLEFNFNSLNRIKEDIGAPIEVIVNFNCNYVLFRTGDLENMYGKLMNDREARSIVALSPVEPGFCIENGRYGLFPFMNDEDMQQESYPRIYRKLGVSILKCGLKYARLQKQTFHPVGREEGIDLHGPEDVTLIEYHLKKRARTAGRVHESYGFHHL